MTWVTVAVVGTSAYLGSRASKKAAGAQGRAAERQLEESQRQFDLTREDYAPWREAGTGALEQMQQYTGLGGEMDPSMITQTPGYQFRLNEMVKGMDRSASARGMLRSGRYGKELGRYLQDYASTEYGNAFNRLSTIAGLGSSATTSGAQIGANLTGQMTGAIGRGGQARASGYLGQGAAWNNAIQGGMQNYMFNQYLNRPSLPYSAGYGGGSAGGSVGSIGAMGTGGF